MARQGEAGRGGARHGKEFGGTINRYYNGGKMKLDEKTIKEKCICECGKNKRILKHFEKCEICFSEAYHRTPTKLNPEEKV